MAKKKDYTKTGATEEEETLDLLEELLSITETLVKHHLDKTDEDRKAWERIASRAADLRDGENV